MNFGSRNLTAPLGIDFIIVGASLAGLTCAIALRRVGHRVVVLEKDATIGEAAGGCRLPPNLTKILYRWGLESELDKISASSTGLHILQYETGEFLGAHEWNEEMMQDLEGSYLTTTYSAMQKLLYKTALAYGAQVRLGNRVLYVDPTNRIVTLESGDLVEADVIIGADGQHGVCRSIFSDENDEPDMTWNVYRTTIPVRSVLRDPSLSSLFSPEKISRAYHWGGSMRAASSYLLGGTGEIVLHLHTYGDGPRGQQNTVTKEEMKNAVGDIYDPCLLRLIDLAEPPVCLPLCESGSLEEWVHEDGRMVLLGDAAHPMPQGYVQESALCIEDAAVLARLFARLHSKDQIPIFLYAFQELQQTRCEMIQRRAQEKLFLFSDPLNEGTVDERVEEMRERLLSTIVDEDSLWTELVEMFGYDAEDAADEWWIQWGALKKRMDGDVKEFEMVLSNVRIVLEVCYQWCWCLVYSFRNYSKQWQPQHLIQI
ncbi:hypothetical protein AMATHDRAFT_59738 [Amanita thiersii Skay4041]|uniref:FAD-binding domain-containing protein n=1 Tax=Amanita thiersii Skay4041 TaxID=703135 RepID=A0A2A9NRX0_9AGAR|nr:hypothetical protein AMATHDRAFT_59738 [Amanita thiersii Skay4041]